MSPAQGATVASGTVCLRSFAEATDLRTPDLQGRVLRSSCNRIDDRGVGPPINYRLSRIGPEYLANFRHPCTTAKAGTGEADGTGLKRGNVLAARFFGICGRANVGLTLPSPVSRCRTRRACPQAEAS